MKPLKCYLSFFFILISTSIGLIAQTSNFVQYGAAENLPSNEVYELFQDSKGYIWALTDEGVYRFNGVDFEEIIRTKELETKLPVDILEDKKGSIWILFLEGEIGEFTYSSGKIIPHPMNNEITDKLASTKYYRSVLNNSFNLMDDGGLVYSFYQNGYLTVYLDTVFHYVNSFESEFKVIKVGGVDLLIEASTIDFINQTNDTLSFSIYGNKKNIFFNYDKYSTGAAGAFCLTIDNSIYIIYGSLIVRIEEKEVKAINLFDHRILGASQLNKDELVLLKNGEPPEIIDSKTLKHLRPSSIPFNFVSYCIKDDEGGVWYSTLKNGIIHIPNPKLSTYLPLNKQEVSSLYWYDDKLYYGTSSGKVGYFKGRKHVEITPSKVKSSIVGFMELSGELHCLFNEYLLKIEDSVKTEVFFNSSYLLCPKDYLVKNDTLFFARINGLNFINNAKLYLNNEFVFREDSSTFKFSKANTIFRLKSICLWGNSIIAIHNNSIISINKKTNKKTFLFDSTKELDLIRSNENGVVFASNKELYWWGKEQGVKQIIFDGKEVYINCLTMDNSDIWLATTNGLYKLRWNDLTKEFESFHLPLGLDIHNKNIQTIFVLCDSIVLGTSNGLFKVPRLKLLEQPKKLKLFLNKIERQGIVVDRKAAKEYDYKQNAFTFYIDLLNTKNRSDIDIFYRITDDQEWRKTRDTKIEFPYLPPNEYHFQVRACLNGECSSIQDYYFIINPPFWQRFDLRLTIFMGVLIIVLFILIRRIKKIKKEQAIELKIKALENRTKDLHQQALRAQMNPHFLFNALSSIQAFILTNDIETSEKYLIDFGHLMRLILNSSVDRAITIEKEVKLLEVYLSLQQLLYNFSFDFKVTYDDSLFGEDLKIPVMILQPLIENAVVHGVKGVEKGEITVNFTDKDKYIECTIQDNGKGDSKSVKTHDGITYKSRATKIITDRLELIKIEYPITSIEFIELKNFNKTGVIVKVALPIIH